MAEFKMTKRKLLEIFGIFSVVGLAACGSTPTIDPSFVAERWSKTLDAFNIDTVYPPRYMQPGDVFLVTEPEIGAFESENRYKRRSIRLGRADVTEYLKKDAKLNLQLPLTSEASPTKDIHTYPGKTVRLNSMGFTGFNISSVKESDIGITSPIGIFKSMFGLGTQNNLMMSISVPNAKYVEIPAYDAFVAFAEFCNEPSRFASSKCLVDDNDALAMALKSIALDDDALIQKDPSTQNLSPYRKKVVTIPKIAFVTQVYYARQIDYYYGTNHGSAFTASAALIKGTDAAAITPSAPSAETKEATKVVAMTTPPPTNITTTISNSFTPVGDTVRAANSSTSAAATKAGVDSVLSDLAKAQALAAELQKRVDEMQSKLNDAGRGGMLRVIRATSEGTVLRQTFETPVAIGFRALWWSPIKSQKGGK